MKNIDIAHEILENLSDLKPYIYKRARSGSVYLKFDDVGLRSIRIADHEGYEKYQYKWNIRKDVVHRFMTEDNGIVRYYFSFHELDEFYEFVRMFYHNLTTGEIKKGIFSKRSRS